jgi:hypothetical protein
VIVFISIICELANMLNESGDSNIDEECINQPSTSTALSSPPPKKKKTWLTHNRRVDIKVEEELDNPKW